MRPTLHPRLVNGRFGDPAVYVEALHRSNALLFDLGDLAPLGTRDLLRVGHVFVSHMHMDHFVGFDRLLRPHIGRDKRIVVVGPAGIAAAVGHKLQAYSWDLAERYATDLIFDVVEVKAPDTVLAALFRFKNRFAEEALSPPSHSPGPVFHWPDFDLQVTVLEHHGQSLGFAVQEPLHVNVWKNRLEERELQPGAWLQPLKHAIASGAGDELLVELPGGEKQELGALRELVSAEPGQKVAYVTDIGDTPANRAAVAELAARADILFIEASFAAADTEQAAARAHLTTRAAGEMARAAGVRRVEPFHFSPRYEGSEAAMLAEVMAAFQPA